MSKIKDEKIAYKKADDNVYQNIVQSLPGTNANIFALRRIREDLNLLLKVKNYCTHNNISLSSIHSIDIANGDFKAENLMSPKLPSLPIFKAIIDDKETFARFFTDKSNELNSVRFSTFMTNSDYLEYIVSKKIISIDMVSQNTQADILRLLRFKQFDLKKNFDLLIQIGFSIESKDVYGMTILGNCIRDKIVSAFLPSDITQDRLDAYIELLLNKGANSDLDKSMPYFQAKDKALEVLTEAKKKLGIE